MLEIFRGDIYFAKFNKTFSEGSVQNKDRPVIITSGAACNKYSTVVHVAPLTSNLNKTDLPTHVFISKNFGLKYDSLALLEQETPISKMLLLYKIGECSPGVMLKIDRAIKIHHGMIKPFDISWAMRYIDRIKYNLILIERGDVNNAAITSIEHDVKLFIEELKIYCSDYNVNYQSLLYKYCSQLFKDRFVMLSA